MGGPSKRHWREGRERQEKTLISSWTEQWRMGRHPQSPPSDLLMTRYGHELRDFPTLPLWMVEDLARQEAGERIRRAVAKYNDGVERASRRKAGEMV